MGPSLIFPAQISVGSDKEADLGGFDNLIRWSPLPASIPPHSIRALLVRWDSNVCQDSGAYQPPSVSRVPVMVHVGDITKREDIQLLESVALTATKQSRCR